MSEGPNKPRIILPPGVTLPSEGADEPQSNPGGQAEGDARGAEWEARVAELEQALQEKEREMLRLRAEMENVRKRIQRTAEERIKFAGEGLVRDLLVVADDLDRALHAAAQSQDIQALMEGVRLVQMQFLKVLGDHGVHPVPTEGMRFDPAMHEAVGVEERTDVADQTVMAVHRQGYSLHERVVRAAQVLVSRNPEEQAEQARAAAAAAAQPEQPVHPRAEQSVMEPEVSLEQIVREVLASHGSRLELEALRAKLAAHPAGEGSRAPLAAVEELGSPRLERVLEAMPDVAFDGKQATLTEYHEYERG